MESTDKLFGDDGQPTSELKEIWAESYYDLIAGAIHEQARKHEIFLNDMLIEIVAVRKPLPDNELVEDTEDHVAAEREASRAAR